jgi:hypothetical protein
METTDHGRLTSQIEAAVDADFVLMCSRSSGIGNAVERPTSQLAFCCICGDKILVSYTGKIQNGVVILPPGVKLPEGTEVKVSVPDTVVGDSFADRYERYIGAADDLPSDLAANIDHYVHGQPKK